MKVGKYSSTLYHCHHVLLQPSLVSLKHYQHRQLAYICNVCNVGSGSECSTQFILQSGLACRVVFFASAIHFVCQGSPAPSRSSFQYPGRPPGSSCSYPVQCPGHPPEPPDWSIQLSGHMPLNLSSRPPPTTLMDLVGHLGNLSLKGGYSHFLWCSLSPCPPDVPRPCP